MWTNPVGGRDGSQRSLSTQMCVVVVYPRLISQRQSQPWIHSKTRYFRKQHKKDHYAAFGSAISKVQICRKADTVTLWQGHVDLSVKWHFSVTAYGRVLAHSWPSSHQLVKFPWLWGADPPTVAISPSAWSEFWATIVILLTQCLLVPLKPFLPCVGDFLFSFWIHLRYLALSLQCL